MAKFQAHYLFLFRLIFYATIFDILGCLSTFYKYPMIILPAKVSCYYLISERFFSPFTTFGSRYIICVIAFDRFMRIKHLQEYETKFPKSWYRFLLFIFYISVLYQTCVPSILNIFYVGNRSTFPLALPVNIIVFLLSTLLYTKSFYILNGYKKSNKSVSRTNSDITKITKFYFVLYMISSTCLLSVSIYNWFGKTRFGNQFDTTNEIIILVILNVIQNLTGIINAVVILVINRPIKRKLLLLKIKIHQDENEEQQTPNNNASARNIEQADASL